MSNYPNLQPGLQNARDTVVNNASAAYDSLSQGPAAEKARIESEKTSQEYSNLMNSRKVPDQPAATGQSLTHYHSFFYSLLSWENPRVTTISFASIVTFIFFTRYVPILKYLFKAIYVVLGITSAAEVAGKLVMDRGFASHLRPRKYYTIPRENLEATLDDVEQLVNFFIIELQRIIFAENILVTVGAFLSAFVGYFLVKFVPKWGLALLTISLIYTLPLIYINNREVIDSQISQAGDIITQQTQQVRDLAVHHTNRATEIAKSTASDYSHKAQELIGQAQHRAGAADAPNPANLNPAKNEPEREFTKADLPNVPDTLAEKASIAADKISSSVPDTTSTTSHKSTFDAPQFGSSSFEPAGISSTASHQSNFEAPQFGSSSFEPTGVTSTTSHQSNFDAPQFGASSYEPAGATPLTELGATSVPLTEPSFGSHEAPLRDTFVHGENSAPENIRSEAPLL